MRSAVNIKLRIWKYWSSQKDVNNKNPKHTNPKTTNAYDRNPTNLNAN
jgi:hypothetical protein